MLTRRHAIRTAALLCGAPLTAAPNRPTAKAGHLNYHPAGLYVWDTWYFTRGDEVHVIHLQQKRPGSERPDQDRGALGHAVTTDLLTWQELPPALYRGEPGSVDDMDLYTGARFFTRERITCTTRPAAPQRKECTKGCASRLRPIPSTGTNTRSRSSSPTHAGTHASTAAI